MARRKPKLEYRRCAYCNKRFRPQRPKQVYCSDKCRAAAYRQRRQERDLQAWADGVIAQTPLGQMARKMRERREQRTAN